MRTEPIVSTNIRVRHPDSFHVGDYSIVDDFCYFSTQVHIGRFCHIATGCSVSGGKELLFRVGDFGGLSAGCRVYCTSDDFETNLLTILPPELADLKFHMITGDVLMDDYTCVGSNSVVMPDTHIPEGTAVGAMSFVPPGFDFEPWSLYAGIPVRRLKARRRDLVLEQAERALERLSQLG